MLASRFTTLEVWLIDLYSAVNRAVAGRADGHALAQTAGAADGGGAVDRGWPGWPRHCRDRPELAAYRGCRLERPSRHPSAAGNATSNDRDGPDQPVERNAMNAAIGHLASRTSFFHRLMSMCRRQTRPLRSPA